MRKIIPNEDGTPLCPEDDHDWEYDPGDYSVGINPGWICTACGAIDVDSPPPEDDWDYR